ncbi:hypothetical protein EMIT0347P_20185 [Pseudomonas sp. IT-347P]
MGERAGVRGIDLSPTTKPKRKKDRIDKDAALSYPPKINRHPYQYPHPSPHPASPGPAAARNPG